MIVTTILNFLTKRKQCSVRINQGKFFHIPRFGFELSVWMDFYVF